MRLDPPALVSKALLICRRVIQDTYTGERILVSPVNEISAPTYPVTAELAVFALWTSAHGAYQIEIQLRDLDENIVWSERESKLLECSDPLVIFHVVLQQLHVVFPHPGRFEFVFLANDMEVARIVFAAQVAEATPS